MLIEDVERLIIDYYHRVKITHDRVNRLLNLLENCATINANALNWAKNADKAQTRAKNSHGRGSNPERQVPQAGIEPATLRLEGECSIH